MLEQILISIRVSELLMREHDIFTGAHEDLPRLGSLFVDLFTFKDDDTIEGIMKIQLGLSYVIKRLNLVYDCTLLNHLRLH